MAVLKRQGIQLAYPAEEGRINRLGSAFYVQPKLNGGRIKIESFHGEPVLLSSYGNELVALKKLKEHITVLWKRFGILELDGEGYIHGWDRERIDSAMRTSVNYNPDSDLLQFHAFDIPDSNKEQWDRIVTLIMTYDNTELFKLVPTFLCKKEQWKDLLINFIDTGYEGIILRKVDSLYVPKRTVNMLKYKPSEIDEYTIVDVIEAISIEGEEKGMVGSFKVQADEGDIFNVGAGKLKHSERVLLWKRREEIKGKTLIVKHEKVKTSNNIPVCCVAVEVKE